MRYTEFPPCLKSSLGVKQVIDEACFEGFIGFDVEYSKKDKPYIIGVASKGRCASHWWSDDLGWYLLEQVKKHDAKLVAFSGIGADKPVIEAALKTTTPLSMWHDTMIRHWIVNPDLASVPKSAVGEDADDPAVALGLMNLWCCTSLLHDVPNWKRPRGRDGKATCNIVGCRGPCPIHDEMAYCGTDAWAGLVDGYSLIEEMKRLEIPETYFDFRQELAEYCEWMTEKGVLVDRQVIKDLDEAITSKKMTLFPYEWVTTTKTFKNGTTRELKPKKVQTGPFNPNSPKAVYKWFAEHGIDLSDKGKPSASKPTVQKVLTKLLKPYGLEFNATLGEVDGELSEDLTLSEPLEVLVRLAQKQCAGKGIKSWFDPQYIDKDNLIHPRFNTCGTSMGRLSSSKPNFQNIPRVGFGKEVRKAIIACPGFKLLSADFSQLEFRICLWFVGLDPNVADGAFEYLVEKSEGQFKEPAKRLGWTPRDVAKSIIHGCVPKGHEVLTPEGWIDISEWSGQDIATWYDKEQIRFEQPEKYHKYPFSGNLVNLKGRGLEVYCTKNHTFPVEISGTGKGKRYSNTYKQEASNLSRSGRIPISGEFHSALPTSITDTELKKLVAVQADGAWNGHSVRFHFVKERKIERVNELWNGVVWKDCKCHPGRGKYCDVPFSSKYLSIEEKNFHSDLMGLSQKQRLIFINETKLWDGSISTRNDGASCYITTNYENAKFVQTMVHLSGFQGLLRVEKRVPIRKDLYKVSFNARKYSSISTLERSDTCYIGDVYCFTVPSGYFLLRHNDKIFVSGNSDYMESLSVRSDEELNSPKSVGDRKAGALVVYDGLDGYPEWKYKGKTVCFTGVNVSERLFGDKTRVNRAKALKLLKVYLDAYPIRQFQMELTKKVEASGDMRLPNGHRLPLYGRVEEDDLKQAAALLGQGGGGIYSQEGMLRLKNQGKIMIMQVHDDYTFEVPIDTSNAECMDYLRPMVAPSEILTGFTCPAKVKVGLWWKSREKDKLGNPINPDPKDMQEIGTLKVTNVVEGTSSN